MKNGTKVKVSFGDKKFAGTVLDYRTEEFFQPLPQPEVKVYLAGDRNKLGRWYQVSQVEQI